MSIRTGRRGFALVAALGLLVALSVVALELSTAARVRRRAVAAASDRMAAVLAADAGIAAVQARLGRLLRGASGAAFGLPDKAAGIDPWEAATLLGPETGRVGDFQYRVTIRDAGTRLNLNRAGEDELRRLMLALRIDAGRADRVAQAIADWRDADDARRARGAERADYVRAGAVRLPDDGPFARLGALRDVAGMSDSLAARLRPYLTLAGSGRIDINAADRPVLLALPGMTEESASAVLRARQSGRRIADLDRLAQELPAGARESLREAMPRLRAMTVLRISELEVRSESSREGDIAQAHVDAVISRDDDGRIVWKRVRP